MIIYATEYTFNNENASQRHVRFLNYSLIQRVSLLVGSEFRVRKASFELKSEFRVRKWSLEYGKWVSSKEKRVSSRKTEFRVKTTVSFE